MMNIGFILEQYEVPSWIYMAIEKALSLKSLKPCIMILDHTKAESHLQKNSIMDSLNLAVFNRYSEWDKSRYQKRYINKENDAFYLKDIRNLIPDVPCVEIRNSDDITAIKKYNPDVLFHVGASCVVDDAFLGIATQGVWCFRHGDPSKNRNGPTGFWEVFHNEGTIFSVLQRLTKSTGEGQNLAVATIATNEEHSLLMTSNALAWDSAPLLYLCLKQLINKGTPFIVADNSLQNKTFKHQTPHLLSTMALFFKFIYRKLKNPPGFIAQHWSIQISKRSQQSKVTSLDPKFFNPLIQPPDKFWADPFLIYKDDKEYLFFEEYDYTTKKGLLRVGELNEHGFVNQPITILEDNFHLSNPYVFFEDDVLYLLPEQAESGEITLYKCVEFPGKWEKAKTFLQGGYYVDPILLKENGKWWLFFVEKMSEHGQPTIYGKLWFSDSLYGDWQEHPMSPISMDCRFSRSAGTISYKNDQLMRAVQDCSHGYGHQIHFLKITKLTETEYEEEYVKSITPAQFNVEGIHTINCSKELIAIDTRKRISKKEVIFKRDEE